jgi:hypothetical protein
MQCLALLCWHHTHVPGKHYFIINSHQQSDNKQLMELYKMLSTMLSVADCCKQKEHITNNNHSLVLHHLHKASFRTPHMWQKFLNMQLSQPAITASLPGPNVLNAPFSNTHGPVPTLNVTDHVSQT